MLLFFNPRPTLHEVNQETTLQSYMVVNFPLDTYVRHMFQGSFTRKSNWGRHRSLFFHVSRIFRESGFQVIVFIEYLIQNCKSVVTRLYAYMFFFRF